MKGLIHLNPTYEGLDPLKYGWKIENDILRPLWFDGAPLPSKKELNENVEGRIDLIPTDEPETEHTEGDGSNDQSGGEFLSFTSRLHHQRLIISWWCSCIFCLELKQLLYYTIIL